MRSKLFLAISALAGAGLASFTQLAVANDEGVTLPLQVVSATGYRQQALLAPAAITVIDREHISRAPVADLGEVFRDIPGVAIVDSNVAGMKRLSLRGENSRRVLIKINGQPLADHSNYGTPLLLDPAMIERIEVVRGSASVVHGSNAVGGVVNIITRQVQPGDQELSLSAGYYSATRGYRASAGVLGATESIDYRLQVSRSEQGDRRIPHDRLENSDSDNKSVSAELGYRFGLHRIAWQGDYFRQAADTWFEPTPPMVFTLTFPERETKRNSLSYLYENEEALFQRVEARVYHHEGKREMVNTSRIPSVSFTTSTSYDDLTTQGVQLTTTSQWLSGNNTVLGIEYQSDELDADKYEVANRFVPVAITTYTTSSQVAEQSFWSAFVQQQVGILDNLELNIGARFYQMDSELKRSTVRSLTDQDDDQLLGSVGLVWQLSDSSAVRANIAQGYTYPSVTQQFSATPGNRVMNFGNPELQPEESTTYELGYRVDNRNLMLDTTLYFVDSENFIDKEPLTTAPAEYTGTYSSSTRLFRWINVSEAKTYGLELTLAYQIDALRPYINLSAQKRELIYAPGNSTWKSGLPIYRARAGVEWSLSPNLNMDLFLRSYGHSEYLSYDASGAPVLEETSTYVTPNISIQYQPDQHLNVTLALSNLTNRSYRNPEELPAAERALDMEVSWRF